MLHIKLRSHFIVYLPTYTAQWQYPARWNSILSPLLSNSTKSKKSVLWLCHSEITLTLAIWNFGQWSALILSYLTSASPPPPSTDPSRREYMSYVLCLMSLKCEVVPQKEFLVIAIFVYVFVRLALIVQCLVCLLPRPAQACRTNYEYLQGFLSIYGKSWKNLASRW